ncbi:hypothetical protein AB0O01_15005 [Streptomyces sp. NPDC093252]|uniref:hypothetical protein n=1 Tax=Streptomyces sp. NPDC093252 TaxID=3154980 RepID=UPI00342891D4
MRASPSPHLTFSCAHHPPRGSIDPPGSAGIRRDSPNLREQLVAFGSDLPHVVPTEVYVVGADPAVLTAG